MVFSPNLPFRDNHSPISPWLEMGAYEALWAKKGASFKTIAERFEQAPNALPSEFVARNVALEYAARAHARIQKYTRLPYGIRVHGAGEYPQKVRDARHPIEVLYFQGFWALSERPSIAIVGTRSPSEDGAKEARRIVLRIIEGGFTPVSGLARGIDTIVHETALAAFSPTVAVIGTPISMCYPPENSQLQEEIARRHLLVSQVPVVEYENMPLSRTKSFFPARNATMSALTDATIIIEAGEGSGSLTQAKAALEQGRKLFILQRCFEQNGLDWPEKFESAGAIRVSQADEIFEHLGAPHKN